jgi:CspA family cold shock protein
MFLTGRVKWFDKRKGYGFVESARGDIFIHYSFFKEEGLVLNNDDLISFNAIEGEKGLKAQNIAKVG